MEQMIPVIPVWVMIAIGVFLMVIEMLTMSFVLVLFGLAFVVTGIAGTVITFSSGEIQLITAFALGLVLTLFLRKTLQQKIYSSKELEMETLKAGEVGQIIATSDGDFRVAYKGTTWAIGNNNDLQLKDGMSVQIQSLENNKAYIQIK